MTFVRGSLPWAGLQRSGRGHYGPVPQQQERTAKFQGGIVELRTRRTTEQLEAALAARLAELRADPPRGYPC